MDTNMKNVWKWGLTEARDLHDELVTFPSWDAEDLVFKAEVTMDHGLEAAEDLREAMNQGIWVDPLVCDGCDEPHINGGSRDYMAWQFEGESHLDWIYSTNRS